MKKGIIGAIGVWLLVGVCACGSSADANGNQTDSALHSTEREEYASRLVSLGEYKGLSYAAYGERVPTEAEVEEEMLAILGWFENAELTDEFVKEHLDFASVEEFRLDTEKNLREVYEEQDWSAAATELFEQVMADSRFEMAQEDVEAESREYLESIRQAAEENDISYEEYVESVYGITVEELEAKAAESAEKVVQVSLTAEAIVEQEKLDVEAAYPTIVQQMADEDGWDSVETLETAAGGRESIEKEVVYRMAAEFMMEQGTPVR